MVVEVVAGEVGEDASGESQSGNAVLVGGVRADFHCRVFTAFFRHLVQKHVDCQRVGCGLLCRHGTRVDIVAYRREESGLVSAQPRHLVDEGGGCGLAVGAGDTDESEAARGVAIPLRGKVAERYGAVFHLYVCHAVEKRFGHGLHHDSGGMPVGQRWNEAVSVDSDAVYGHKHCAVGDFTGVVGQKCNRAVDRSDDLCRSDRAEQMSEVMLHGIYLFLYV